MSLYGRYITERQGKQILETDEAFVTYTFTPNGGCYIEDIYVLPEHRKSGIPQKFEEQITQIAKDNGCTFLLGSVVPSTINSTRNLQNLFANGYTLDSCVNNFIMVRKDI